MIRHYLYTFLLLLLALLFNNCAQIGSLTGGERDTTPPKLLEALPALSSVNFNSTKITLRFDEYVKLKDLKNQLLISPGLKTEPEITSEGKKVVVSLKKDELLPNTTYRIYFGKSVADMTEGNSIPNFEYIFSTGTYIDSLKLKGLLTDAYTEQPAGDVLVGLYNIDKPLIDSFIYKRIPDYITRSEANGEYSFSNLPKKSFKVIAFSDNNKNYTYDGDVEKIGFKETPLELNSDSSLNLYIFRENPSRLFIKKTLSPYYGVLNVIYNRKSVFKTRTLSQGTAAYVNETLPGIEKDTITLVYDHIKDSIGIVILDLISKRIDTVKVTLPKLNLQRKKSLLVKSNAYTGILPLNLPFEFSFLNSIDTIKSNTSKIHLIYTKDSIVINESVKLHYTWPLGAVLSNTLTEGRDYKLKIDSAAFYDLNGRYNDSLVINFKRENKTDLGKVTIKMLLNKKQAYIIQLLNDKGQIAKQEFFSLSLSSSNAVSIDFTSVTPGSYTVKVIYDDNENKKWDTGTYLMNKQPEKVFISSKQIKALPDWEIEEEILIK